MNRFVRYIQQVGDLLIYLFKLHMLAILHILKGGLVLGLFPTLASLIEIFHACFEAKTYAPLRFSQRWKGHLSLSNKVGWILCPICLFILFEIYLSTQFIRLTILNLFLCFILLLTCFVLTWSLVSLVRYQLSPLQHIKQGFFLLLASFFDTLAIGLATSIILVICLAFPFALLFMGLPLLMLPTAWFSYIVTRRIERNNH